jgi:hypothetical protein
MHAPETDVFPADRLIQIARKEVEYSAMPEVFLGAGVLLLDHFSCEGDAALAGFCPDELQKLLAGGLVGAALLERHHDEKRKSQSEKDDPEGVEWLCNLIGDLLEDWEPQDQPACNSRQPLTVCILPLKTARNERLLVYLY